MRYRSLKTLTQPTVEPVSLAEAKAHCRIDTDADNDTIPDQTEGTTDTDGTGGANYVDTESDGDTILDRREFVLEGTFPPNVDGLRVSGDELELRFPGAGDRGASRLRVRIEAEGGPIAVRAETIEETLPGGAKPTRLGLDFTQPVARGKIRLSITRAEPLLTADAASLAAPTPAKLGNLSTLNATQPGEGGLIAGFSLAGSGRKQVLVRAVGPGIGQFGVTSTLRDPVLILRAANGAEVTRNDNWPAAIGPSFSRAAHMPPTGEEPRGANGTSAARTCRSSSRMPACPRRIART